MADLRVGLGHDIHRLVPGHRLVLGGVEIPFSLGLAGHSDADVLTHAVIDALLGAVGEGDIGRHFPDTDPAYADANSLALLEKVLETFVRKGGWQVVNVDSTILAECPRLAPHREKIRNTLAKAIRIPPQCVSVKASTYEGLDAIGREEAMAAHAIVLIMR